MLQTLSQCNFISKNCIEVVQQQQWSSISCMQALKENNKIYIFPFLVHIGTQLTQAQTENYI